MAGQKGQEREIYPVYVVWGKDRRVVVDRVSAIRAEVLQGADEQLSLSSYEGEEVELATVLDGLRTVPFLSGRRLVEVREADDFISQHRESLEAYLKKPCATGVLMLVAVSFPGNTRLAKLAAKIGKVYACEPLKPGQLGGFLRDYARREYHLEMTQEAVGLLVELAGEDSGILCREVDKIATYLSVGKGSKGRIEAEEVQLLVGNNREYNVFNVIDAMTANRCDLALQRLEQMLSQDREAQYKAVGAFAWHFRRLYHGRLLLEQGVKEEEMVLQQRVWYNKQAFVEQVRRISIGRIGECLRSLRDIDLASKTGGGTVRSGLEKLMVEFCGRFGSLA